MEHDTLATRLSLILQKLISGQRFRLEDLSFEFNVSKRTIQRDLNERLCFLDIVRDKEGYYSLDKSCLGLYGLKDIRDFVRFSGIEKLYPRLDKSMINEILESKQTPMSPHYLPPPPIFSSSLENHSKEATPKILIKNKHIESSAKLDEVFYRLKNASFHCNVVKFIYKEKMREVNPYILMHNEGVWYLLADENGTLKHFTLSKITCLEILQGQKFQPSEEILNAIWQSFTTWISQNPILVRLRISNEVREYLFRKNFLTNYKIIEESQEYFIAECYFGYANEVFNLVKSFLPCIKILSPESLQEELNSQLQEYLHS